MPPVGFELTISAGERPHTYTLDRAVTGTGGLVNYTAKLMLIMISEGFESKRCTTETMKLSLCLIEN